MKVEVKHVREALVNWLKDCKQNNISFDTMIKEAEDFGNF